MPCIIVLTAFKFAHEGIRVEEFEPSAEPRDTTDECADLAVKEGWAELAKTDEQLAAEAAAEAQRQAEAAAEAQRQASLIPPPAPAAAPVQAPAHGSRKR